MNIISSFNQTVPKAKVEPYVFHEFGYERVDNYYWLKDRENPEVLNYLNQENEYTDKMALKWRNLQDSLYKGMRSRIKEQDESLPVWNNGYFYYSKTENGKEYYKLYRRQDIPGAKEELLLDIDVMAEGHAYFNLGAWVVSPDNKTLLFGLDTISRRQYSLFLKDLTTGKTQSLGIENTAPGYVWLNDSKSFVYIVNNPETLLTEQVKLHVLNQVPNKDLLLYQEKDNRNYLSIYPSRNRKYLFLSSNATMSSEIWYAALDAKKPSLKQFSPRREQVKYEVDAQDNKFVIRTNAQEKNFSIMQCPLDNTHYKYWKDLLKHPHGNLIENMEVFREHIVLLERDQIGLLQIRIVNKENKSKYLSFVDKDYSLGLGENNAYDLQKLRLHYSSLVQAPTWYDYDLASDKNLLLKQKEIPNYNPAAYFTERILVKARDGAMVPVSLVYRKDMSPKKQSRPLLLYGYGSYGVVIDPDFSISKTALLDKGVTFAIAHIRGGEDLGRTWYEQGKLLNKKNTFYDFIDVAQYLVDQKYTTSEQLFAEGGSAGGLLMGSVMNMSQNLFKGILANVPFVDVLTTMQDSTIPLTTNEYDEWGNPSQKEFYEYMKTYSPYDNVEAKEYPNVLVNTGFYDSQVQYWEPAKWVAKLRALKTDNNLLLLKTNMNAGHGGASGRFAYLEQKAFEYAFLIYLLQKL